jgi:hypothetical protein
MKRKAKVTGNEWSTNARSGPMVQHEALTVARYLGNDQFKASTEWLNSFKKRHNNLWNGVRGLAVKQIEEMKSVLLKLGLGK